MRPNLPNADFNPLVNGMQTPWPEPKTHCRGQISISWHCTFHNHPTNTPKFQAPICISWRVGVPADADTLTSSLITCILCRSPSSILLTDLAPTVWVWDGLVCYIVGLFLITCTESVSQVLSISVMPTAVLYRLLRKCLVRTAGELVTYVVQLAFEFIVLGRTHFGPSQGCKL
jgi:hypothetical protein